MGKFNCDSVDDVFLCYQERVTTFHEIDSFREIKLEIMVVGVCSKVKSLVMCDVTLKTFKLSFREKVNKRSVHIHPLPCLGMRAY